MYYCIDCGSTDIILTAWMQQENDGTLTYQETTNDDSCYCKDCQRDTNYMIEEEV